MLDYGSTAEARNFTIKMAEDFGPHFGKILSEMIRNPNQYRLNPTDLVAASYANNELVHHFLTHSTRLPEGAFKEELGTEFLISLEQAALDGSDKFNQYVAQRGGSSGTAMMNKAVRNLAKMLAYKDKSGSRQTAEEYVEQAEQLLLEGIHGFEVNVLGPEGVGTSSMVFFGGAEPTKEDVEAMTNNINNPIFYENLQVAPLGDKSMEDSIEFYTKYAVPCDATSGNYRLCYMSQGSVSGIPVPILDASGAPIEISRKALFTDNAISKDGTDNRSPSDKLAIYLNRISGIGKVTGEMANRVLTAGEGVLASQEAAIAKDVVKGTGAAIVTGVEKTAAVIEGTDTFKAVAKGGEKAVEAAVEDVKASVKDIGETASELIELTGDLYVGIDTFSKDLDSGKVTGELLASLKEMQPKMLAVLDQVTDLSITDIQDKMGFTNSEAIKFKKDVFAVESSMENLEKLGRDPTMYQKVLKDIGSLVQTILKAQSREVNEDSFGKISPEMIKELEITLKADEALYKKLNKNKNMTPGEERAIEALIRSIEGQEKHLAGIEARQAGTHVTLTELQKSK
jgi:hypothetical protein